MTDRNIFRQPTDYDIILLYQNIDIETDSYITSSTSLGTKDYETSGIPFITKGFFIAVDVDPVFLRLLYNRLP